MPGLIMAVGTAWKRALYLSFLFLLVALKQRIEAVPPPSSPTSVLGWGGVGLLLTRWSKVILWPCVPWPGLWAGLPSYADECVCVCVCVCVWVWVCAHPHIGGGSIVTVVNLFASCRATSPSLTVAKSRMVRDILSFSFSKNGYAQHWNYRGLCASHTGSAICTM